MDFPGNQTNSKLYFTKRHYFTSAGRFWSVAILLESVAILVGNVVALRIFLRRKFIASKTCFLLINLTVADLLVGLWQTAILIVMKTVPPPYRRGSPLEFIKFFIPIVSLPALAVISVERAIAVFKPFRYRVLKKSRYCGVIIASWLIASVPWVVRVQDFESRANKDARKAILGFHLRHRKFSQNL